MAPDRRSVVRVDSFARRRRRAIGGNDTARAAWQITPACPRL